MYNEEIRRLQEKDMSLDDLEAEDSGYIQEDKLKHKVSRLRASREGRGGYRERRGFGPRLLGFCVFC